jgi:TolA-binding protein
MKKLAYGLLSGLLMLAVTVPVGATTPTSTIVQPTTVAQSNSATIEQMFREQKVLTDEIQALMAQMKTMMAEMKALTSLPEGQAPTMADLYKQQQVILARLETLSQSRFDTLVPKKNAATVQEVHQQQVAMIADLKTMMAELKTMAEVYRGRAGAYKK